MMKGEGEAQVGKEAAEGGGPGPGPAMVATLTATDLHPTPVTQHRPRKKRHKKRQRDNKEGDGVGLAIGANTDVNNPLLRQAHQEEEVRDAASGPAPAPAPAPATAHPSTTCSAADDPDPDTNALFKDQNRQQDKEDDSVGPTTTPGPAIGANLDVNSLLQGQEEMGPGPGPAPTMNHHLTKCNNAEDPSANPLFKNDPSRKWKLHSNPDAMVKEDQNVMDWIDQLLEKEAGIYCIEEEGQCHYIHQTTDGPAFFKLELEPDVEALATGQAMEGVTLAFSLKDLYLLGFLYKNTWYFYSDATLDGSGHDLPGNDSYWDYLPFNGGYAKDMFTNVKVGAYELNLSHHALSEYLIRLKKGQQDEIQSALYRIIVVIAEAKRFPQWLRALQKCFADNLSRVAGNSFGKLFQDWSNISKKVLDGAENFEPDNYCSAYGELVSMISVVLKSAGDDMSVGSIDWESREAKFVFDSDYDLKEEKVDDKHEEREEEEEAEHKDREEEGEEDSDQKEEDEKDAVAEENEKSRGRGQNCCGWISFLMCIVLVLLVWMIVF